MSSYPNPPGPGSEGTEDIREEITLTALDSFIPSRNTSRPDELLEKDNLVVLMILILVLVLMKSV